MRRGAPATPLLSPTSNAADRRNQSCLSPRLTLLFVALLAVAGGPAALLEISHFVPLAARSRPPILRPLASWGEEPLQR